MSPGRAGGQRHPAKTFFCQMDSTTPTWNGIKGYAAIKSIRLHEHDVSFSTTEISERQGSDERNSSAAIIGTESRMADWRNRGFGMKMERFRLVAEKRRPEVFDLGKQIIFPSNALAGTGEVVDYCWF